MAQASERRILGSAFQFGLTALVLSTVLGLIALVTSSGETIVTPEIFTGKSVTRPPYFLFFLYPAGMAFVLTISYVATRAKPSLRDTPFRTIVLMGTIFVLLICHLAVIAWRLGVFENRLPAAQFIGALAGLLLIVAGNYLPKTLREDSLDLPRPWSYFFSIPWTLPFAYLFGVRTWWTLESDHVWTRTQRLAGRLWMLSGLGLAATPWFTSRAHYNMIALAAMCLMIGVPIAYSFLIRHQAKDALISDV